MSPALRVLHRGRAQPRSVAPPFEPREHDPRIVALAARGWQRLLDGERDSFVAASMVAADLGRLGAPEALLAEAARVVEDEARHVAVVATVVRAFGAEPSVVDPVVTRDGLGPGTLRERLLRTLVAGFVVGETLSAETFAAARARPMVPIAHWAYDELLRDEATHGGFGERAAAWMLDGVGPTVRLALWPACAREMEHFEREVGGPLTDAVVARVAREPRVQLDRLGMMSSVESCGVVVPAIERRVLPRLRKLGVVV